jgi:hypothetical protein
VFYDRKGRDWDAVITSIVDNPISLRQAFWSPYKKFVRMIDEMAPSAPPPPMRPPIGASGQAVTAAAKAATAKRRQAAAPAEPKKSGRRRRRRPGRRRRRHRRRARHGRPNSAEFAWWQLPLIVIGVMLAISLPAVIIAFLKLRQRTLGPILEANGWAVNGRVKINIPFGTALTERAMLPSGARRSLEDPYEDKAAAAAAGRSSFSRRVLAAVGIRWDHSRRGRYFWQPKVDAVQVVVPPPPARNPRRLPPSSESECGRGCSRDPGGEALRRDVPGIRPSVAA